MAKDPTQELVVRVVNLRRYIELTDLNFTSSSGYEILSNIIHGRFVPLDKDKKALLDLIINEGLVFINDYIPNVNYKEFLDGTADDILIQLLSAGENYTKIIAIRYLFEKERPEKLLPKLKKNYPGACKFVNEINQIENDYIFQLNPLNFFEIPQFYIIQLENFLKNNSGLEL